MRRGRAVGSPPALAAGGVAGTGGGSGTVDDPDVAALRERVTFDADPDLPAGSRRTTVTVETTAGARFERTRDLPPGAHDDPLSDDEGRAKFLDCATRALDGDDVRAAYEALDRLRERDAVADVLATLRP